jgi:hypothetical protein
MIFMTDEPDRYTVAPGEHGALHEAMDRIQAKGEDAIVRDFNQSYWDKGTKGDYYDVWADGELIDTVDSKATAEESYRNYRDQHPKR